MVSVSWGIEPAWIRSAGAEDQLLSRWWGEAPSGWCGGSCLRARPCSHAAEALPWRTGGSARNSGARQAALCQPRGEVFRGLWILPANCLGQPGKEVSSPALGVFKSR